MRPVYLKMSAFGPFAGVAEIDFTLLGTEGVYLLAGETGAGKTTIFDAITFALFGQCSGEARKPEDLRSDYAGPETQTYVDLTFELRGKRYRIKRDPGGYPRAKKRGEGTTVCAAESTMEMPDGSQVSGKRVSEKVTELLGIDANQFGQIVMLAQGDFEKLLTEGTKERTIIFRKIFGTDMYQRFQDELVRQRKELAERCSQGAHEVEILATQALECMEQSDESRARLADWSQRNALQAENAAEALTCEQTLLEGRHSAALEELEHAQAKRDVASQALDRARQAADIRLKAQQAQDKMCEADARIPGLEAAEASCKKACEEVPALQQRAGALREQLPEYAKHTQAQAQAAQAGREHATAQAAYTAQHATAAQAKNDLDELSAKASALGGAREALAKAEGTVASARHNLAAAQALKDAADTAAECGARIENAEKRLQKSDAYLKSLDQEDEEDEQQRAHEAAIEERLAKTPELLSQARLDIQAAKTELEQVGQLSRQLDKLEADLKSKQEAHKRAARNYQCAADEHAALLHELETARRAYEDGLAGVLAAGLAPGTPCPVCGSTDHPHLAAADGQTPTKESVQAAQAREEQASQHATALCAQAQATHELVENAQAALDACVHDNGNHDALAAQASQIQERLTRLVETQGRLKSDNEALEHARTEQQRLRDEVARRARKRQEAHELVVQIKEELAGDVAKRQTALDTVAAAGHDAAEADALLLAAQTELDEATRACRAREADAQALTQAEDSLKQAQDALEKAQAGEEQSRQALDQASQAEQVAKERARLLAERLEFVSEDAARAELSSLENRTLQATSALAEASRALQDARTERTQAAAELDTLHNQLAQLGDLDAAQAQQELSQATDELDAAKARERSCGQARATLADLTARMEALAAKDAKLQQAYARLDRLAGVAGGSMAGMDRLTFETFVQMRYFEVVLAAANTRLSEMTQGQYELVRCERAEGGAAKVGLNVDVLDNFTGKARSAKSLSGGEKFMASLALALGLSEVVQRQAGGIQLDTMFVDEGFGSLDQEKLRLVMRAMARPGAAGKLVGIISHVEELMSTIDRKIVVERGRNGSTLHVEV